MIRKLTPAPPPTPLARARAERDDAPALYEELMTLEPGMRRRAVAWDHRFAILGLVARLLLQARSLDEPTALAEHAGLALELAYHLPEGRYPEALIWDFRSRACRELARARRIQGDLLGATTALDEGQAGLELGTGDLLERARHLEELAALRRQQGQRFEAHRLRRRAQSLYLEIGDPGAAAALDGCRELRHPRGRRRDPSHAAPGRASR